MLKITDEKNLIDEVILSFFCFEKKLLHSYLGLVWQDALSRKIPESFDIYCSDATRV